MAAVSTYLNYNRKNEAALLFYISEVVLTNSAYNGCSTSEKKNPLKNSHLTRASWNACLQGIVLCGQDAFTPK
ncbi:hypothetical protein Echvi_0472 [Echinicola vietnamensis DSM 17526]|uniref:Uncharacterized protein n=1 Tax=Echinicola vietnamensis (strain DSM 17526 / LMG 23754 / KMM 6221) TaxID=926556 RepID=L0FTY1_ECHVK|nr:hypothetical protein Echvi_0472 [Echinicola vietnamensis DSM 17526]